MKSRWLVFTLVASFFAIVYVVGQDKKDESPNPAATELKTPEARNGYAFGVMIGGQLKTQGIAIDAKMLAKGLEDTLTGAKTLLSEAEARNVVMTCQKESMAKRSERSKVDADKNKVEGEDFLAKNKTQPGVVTLPSGLQYKVISEGTGEKPKATDTVKTHYRGTLIDGKEFDSSYSRNEPTSFPVNRVIKGWTEALQLMPVGSKWQLFIPSDLAYGPGGQGRDIGPNATLIFEIELLGIEK